METKKRCHTRGFDVTITQETESRRVLGGGVVRGKGRTGCSEGANCNELEIMCRYAGGDYGFDGTDPNNLPPQDAPNPK